MSTLPSVNQVTLLGMIKKVEHRPNAKFSWIFQLDIPSSYHDRNQEASLTCGASGNFYGKAIQDATIGTDWVLVNGKIRKDGFIQVRELCVIGEVKGEHHPIHHVGVTGKITSIRKYPNTIYEWQFDVVVYPEYGKEDDSEVEAILTCGVAGDGYCTAMIEAAIEGQWATIQGKVRNKGFIQVRSMCVYDIAERG